MTSGFNPNYQITNTIANNILKIERIKEGIKHLPMTPKIMASLRESARLTSIHYSTQIEGNRLTQEEVFEVIKHNKNLPQRVRDEKEIRGYYKALEYVEKTAKNNSKISEKQIQTIHALVENKEVTTTYRDGQNVIKDSLSGGIVYMPPEAFDVPQLMKEFVAWLNDDEIPTPIKAAIAHYQFATIHPYYDGNGRTARLLTTFVLHRGGYDLKGIYSLEEYYAKDLHGYYEALTVGPSHNYYMGRTEADVTKWVEYFTKGMVVAFENVYNQTLKYKADKDLSPALKELDPKQRQVLTLFENQNYITSNDVADFFNFSQRSARQLTLKWAKEGFLEIADESKKGRKYKISKGFENLTAK